MPMNDAASSFQSVWSRAEHVLALKDDRAVQAYVSDLVKDRQLSDLVRTLNDGVLDDSLGAREQAVAALRKLGLWIE
jgi:hypothetical protein